MRVVVFCTVSAALNRAILQVLLLMEMVQELVRFQPVLVQDQPQEPGAAHQKYRSRPNSWSTMKQQLFHNLTGNGGGVASRTSVSDSEPLEHERVRTWCNIY